jgi:transposase
MSNTNNAENLPATSERVDDIPLLLAQLKEMRVPELLNQSFPTHGNWQGLSLGHLVTVWLTFILSESNHRLSHLRTWTGVRLQTLAACLGVPVVETDFTDDRLAQALDYLNDREGWRTFEDRLNQDTIRIYELETALVRLDSTTAKSYGQVTEDGLLQFGHSKDRRPDLPQLKIQASTLDPLGLPLTTTITSGEKADDPLYVPEIERVRESLQRRGLLYVGDSKMAALETRLRVAAGGDYYLCPLPQTQVSAAQLRELIEPVRTGQIKLAAIKRLNEETGRLEKIAEGYEYTVELEAELDGKPVTFTERRLVVRSRAQAQAQSKSLERRTRQAAAEIKRLNERKKGKPRPKNQAELEAAVEAILKRHRVVGLLEVPYHVRRAEQPVRAYGDRPARVRVTEEHTVSVQIDRAAVAEAKFALGWRVYATNAPSAKLSLTKAILAYRGSYLIERGFRRLKGHPLSLQPIYLTTPGRLTGLVRVLLIGLRVLGLIEYKARRALARRGEPLAGLTKGLPKKATARPTTEALLQAFEGITLMWIGQQWYLTPLSALQRRILELLGFTAEIYHCLIPHFSETQIKMGET